MRREWDYLWVLETKLAGGWKPLTLYGKNLAIFTKKNDAKAFAELEHNWGTPKKHIRIVKWTRADTQSERGE